MTRPSDCAQFLYHPCPYSCGDGWVREPDGYGCVQWTLCGRCGGYGYIKEVKVLETQVKIKSRQDAAIHQAEEM